MSSDDRQTSAPPTVKAVPAETAVTPVAATDFLALAHTTPPALIGPEMLVEGLRYLQERIPEFTQLSAREKRSHARAANLDPEFIETGLHAAEAWHHTEVIARRSGAELRREHENIRSWDTAIREWQATLDGMTAANLKRKHRLGTAILDIYATLGLHFRRHDTDPRHAYMRPHYENMKRALLRTQQFGRKRKKKSEEKEEPAAE